MQDQTKAIIEDYIWYSISKNCSFMTQNTEARNIHVPSSLSHPSPLNKTVRELADHLDRDMCINDEEYELYLARITLDTDVAYLLPRISDLVCPPGGSDRQINWGRIMALLGFSGHLAVKFAKLNAFLKVNTIISSLTSVFHTNLSVWMVERGGWDDFYRWSEARIGNEDLNTSASFGFQSLMSVGVVAACAGLIFLISQK